MSDLHKHIFSLLCYSCPLGTVEKLLSWRPWRCQESLLWFHMTCFTQLNAANEFLGICIRSMAHISVSSPKVSLSFSFTSQIFLLYFLLAQFPLATSPNPHPCSVPTFAAVQVCPLLLSLDCPSAQIFSSHCSVQEQQLNIWVYRERGVCSAFP